MTNWPHNASYFCSTEHILPLIFRVVCGRRPRSVRRDLQDDG